MNETNKVWSRRWALRTSLQAFAVAGVARLSQPLAMAASRPAPTSMERALVCIYMGSGFDSNNVLVPLAQYASYASGRASLAIPRADLIELRSQDSAEPDYGLHPSFGELRNLFDSHYLGFVANVGQDTMPAPGAQDASMSFLPGGYEIPAWAARGGAITGFPNLDGSLDSTSAMVMLGAPGKQRDSLFQASLSYGLSTQFPSTSLGRQLQQVAALLQAGPSFGIARPVFACFLGGFAGTLAAQAATYRELATAMASFYQATAELGISGSVTTYTDAPYNRTLAPAANGLATAAWGGHHLVMGGSVLGGQIYGAFPKLRLGSESDATGKGAWIPGQSRDHFIATLASWSGVRHSTPTLRFMAG